MIIKTTYFHQTVELLIRVATEFEANCKGILKANCYPKKLEKRILLIMLKLMK